jgi:Coenzyme PQQ synthesis protein D (PqqD)
MKSGKSRASAPGDRVTVPEHVRSRQFDDEIVILDLAEGEYFALNGVGARMWQALAAGSTPDQVAEALISQYEVQREALVADCLRLVDELVERGLIRLVEPGR